MREIVRLPLSDETVAFLWERRQQIAAAANGPMRPSEREDAQRAEARRLWKLKENKAFAEIRTVLRRMAPGHEHCMYCDYSLGNTIDHFRPLGQFPALAFAWDNYLWSCSACNSDYKGEQFPLDAGGAPLLINPTRDRPREHLGFLPISGKLIGRTPKGERTIEVLGFNRRSNLDRTRRDAWRAVQRLLVLYAEARAAGDASYAIEIERELCTHPHAGLLTVLVDFLDDPGQASLVEEPRCRAVIAAHPEIRKWV